MGYSVSCFFLQVFQLLSLLLVWLVWEWKMTKFLILQ